MRTQIAADAARKVLSVPPMTIVIAHSKPAAQAACRRILRSEKGIRVVSEASTDFEIIQACTTLKPRIILLHMAPSDSGTLITLIRRKSPQTKVIVLADRYSEMGMLKALSLGACGHLITEVLPAFLAKAVRKVDAGEAWVSRKMAARIIDCLARFPLDCQS